MGLASRVLSRLGFGGGALATTVVIIGAFAVTKDDVSLDTLRDGFTSSSRTTAAGVPSTLAPPDPAPTTSPVDTTSSAVHDSAALASSSSAAPVAGPDEPVARHTTSASRSGNTRSTINPTPASATSLTTNTALAQAVLDQINAARNAEGIPALTMSDGLVRSALIHNKVMASGCGLSHQCSGEPDLGKRISAQGITWKDAGENIGQGGPEPDTAEAIVAMAQQLTSDMLAETPPNDGHRKNILSRKFLHAGISLYRDSRGTVWMTQDFAS
jgi:uncharacterized protein YkwD